MWEDSQALNEGYKAQPSPVKPIEIISHAGPSKPTNYKIL